MISGESLPAPLQILDFFFKLFIVSNFSEFPWKSFVLSIALEKDVQGQVEARARNNIFLQKVF